MADRIDTPYGDLWYEVGRYGDLVPTYSNRTCEQAAIAAYIVGDWGALTSVEIAFFKAAGITTRVNS